MRNSRSYMYGRHYGSLTATRAWIAMVLLICLSGPAFGPIFGPAAAQNLNEVTVFQVAGDSGEYLYMEGTINRKTPGQLRSALAENPGVHTIIMLNCPGSADDEANLAMARQVRKRGLNTHLTASSVIDSGAVDFFLAGNDRTMEPGARIGVHSWYDDGDRKEATDYPPESSAHEMNRKYIEDMIGSDEFYWFTIYAARSNGMHYMSQAEIRQYGLLTR